MDRAGADFFKVLDQIREKLHATPVAVQLPIGAEDDFIGIVDLIRNKAYAWEEVDNGSVFDEIDIPEDMKDMVADYRTRLIEGAVEDDEQLFEKYMEDPDSITADEIIGQIRKATLDLRICPVMCGSSFKNKCVQPLLLIAVFVEDPASIAIGVRQARIEALFYCLLSLSHCIAGICRGAGRAFVPMFIMLAIWCVLRITYITIAMQLDHNIILLFWAYPITWCISSVIFLIYYVRSDWVHGFEKTGKLL